MRLRFAVAILSLVAQLAQAELSLVDGYVRGLPPGQSVTAAFMTLRNSGDEELVLTTASTSVGELSDRVRLWGEGRV